MIPESLDGWSLDLVRRLLEQGAFETDRFDFKEVPPHANDDAGKRRLGHAIAAFANSAGGFLVFGVKDDRGLSTAERLVGLPSAPDFPEQFGNYAMGCTPSVEWSFKNPPIRLDGGQVVHVVCVPASRRKPHGVFEDGRWWFCKRTNKGTEPMSYEEIRLAFGDAERRQSQLAWLRAEVERVRDVARKISLEVRDGRELRKALLTRFTVGQLRSLLLSVFGDLGGNQSLVRGLHNLIERCMRIDTCLAPLGAFAVLPRDRSYASTSDWIEFVATEAPGVADMADYVLGEFDRTMR